MRMNRLVQDLLNYSRLSRVELALGPTPLRSAVDGALGQVEGREHVEINVPAGLKVVTHHPTLVQVLYNLISNGLKFQAPGVTPRVVVSAERRGNNVRVEVSDNGIGIDPAHHERIFQVFERLHGLEMYPGTGIGLAIVKRGIERMGGRVGLESELGKGAKFWFEVPAI
jgi:signal transduction histidine kinase